MSKRIKSDRVKKWAIGIGVVGVPLGILLIWYIASLGVFVINDYSGDIVCEGTYDNPCLAFFNISVREDVFIYPNESWKEIVNTDKKVESLRMYRSWGTSWREINLLENCKGTWCGAPDNSGNTKYSFAFREGRDYNIKIEVVKENPTDKVIIDFVNSSSYFFGVIENVYNLGLSGLSISNFSVNGKEINTQDFNSDSFDIKNDFEKTKNGMKQNIYIKNKEDNERTYNYSTITEIAYNKIRWAGKDYYLSSTPIKLSYVLDDITGKKVYPNIFYDDDFNKLIGYKDMGEKGGYALAYEKDEKYFIELKIDNIKIKPGEEFYLDPTYSNTTYGFSTADYGLSQTGDLVANLTDIYCMDYGNGTVYNFGWDGSLKKSCVIGYPSLYGMTSNHTPLTDIKSLIIMSNNGTVMLYDIDCNFQDVIVSNLHDTLGVNYNPFGIIANFSSSSDREITGYIFPAFGLDYILFTDSVGTNLSGFSTENIVGAAKNWWSGFIDLNNRSRLYISQFTENFVHSSDYFGGNVSTYGFSMGDVGAGTLRGTESNGSNYLGSDSTDNFIYNQYCDTCYVPQIPPSINVTELTEIPTDPTDYAFIKNYEFNATVNVSAGVVSTSLLEFNGTNYTAVSDVTNIYNFTFGSFSAGTHSYRWFFEVCQDKLCNVNNTETGTYTINRIVPTGNLTSTNGFSLDYSQGTEFGSESLNGDGDLTYKVFVNTTGWTDVSSGVVNLSVGNYHVLLNTTGGMNYTANKTMDNSTLTVSAIASIVNLTINANASNYSMFPGDSKWINGSMIKGDYANGTLVLYKDGVSFNRNQSDISNLTQFDDEGIYNITVIYEASNNFTQSSRTYFITVNQTYLYFNNDNNSIESELNTNLSIYASTIGEICVDIDHFAYGVNYSCDSDGILNISINISSFRNKLFTTGQNNYSVNITNSSGGWNVSNFSIPAHRYDEVDGFIFNISSDKANSLTFYECNATLGDGTAIIDRAYAGFLIGNNIYLSNFSNISSNTIENNYANISLSGKGQIIKYFWIDDSVKTNGVLNAQLNITGGLFGNNYYDNFENFSYIDFDLTNAQFIPGYIMLENLSKDYFIYDDYDEGIDVNRWFTIQSAASGSFGSNVSEINDYIKLVSYIDNAHVGTTSAYLYSNNTVYGSYYGIETLTSDYVEFRVETSNSANQGAGDNSYGITNLFFGGNNLWTSTYLVQDLGDSGTEVSNSNMSFVFDKVNNTWWSVNITGWEQSEVDEWTSCSAQDGHLIYNYTTAHYTIWSNTDSSCNSSGSLSNSYYLDIDPYIPAITLQTTALNADTNDPVTVIAKIYEVNQSTFERTNKTVITSTSIYDSASDIYSVSWEASEIGYDNQSTIIYLSANDGDNWEYASASPHSFSYPGKHLKWRANISSDTYGFLNASEALLSMNISTAYSYPTNVTFDFGADDTIDYTFPGNLTNLNGTIEVDLSAADLSSAFTSNRDLYRHLFRIPLVIESDTAGLINIDSINITYDPNPVILNSSAVQIFLNNFTGYGNITVQVGSYPSNISINALGYDYAGGNKTIPIKAHDSDGKSNFTLNWTSFYSRWDYNFVPQFIDWLEFIPQTPTSKNVTPYGQGINSTTPILNFTNYGYGGKDVDLFIYENQTLQCVSTFVSTNETKPSSSLWDGLVSYWSFDIDARDNIGNNNGTVSGATHVRGIENEIVLDFDSTSGIVGPIGEIYSDKVQGYGSYNTTTSRNAYEQIFTWNPGLANSFNASKYVNGSENSLGDSYLTLFVKIKNCSRVNISRTGSRCSLANFEFGNLNSIYQANWDYRDYRYFNGSSNVNLSSNNWTKLILNFNESTYANQAGINWSEVHYIEAYAYNVTEGKTDIYIDDLRIHFSENKGKSVLGGAYEFLAENLKQDVGDYIVPKNNISFNASEGATFSFWHKTRSVCSGWGDYRDDRGGLFGLTTDNYDSTISWDDITGLMMIQDEKGTTITTTEILKLNEWQNVIVSFNNTDTYTYINGTLAHQSGTALQNITFDRIGQGYAGLYHNGSIDEVRVYNRSLSADEISELYSRTKNKYYDIKLDNRWNLLNYDVDFLSEYSTTNLWMWADYNCSYSNWNLFNPSLYVRQCCANCSCSEDVI